MCFQRDAHCVSDVTPDGAVANITSLRQSRCFTQCTLPDYYLSVPAFILGCQ
ncbi:MAG: hypothetical protein IKB93_14685 [Clostridia bacterium]|nr:hypothetical protein [Clostridia bacterium]